MFLWSRRRPKQILEICWHIWLAWEVGKAADLCGTVNLGVNIQKDLEKTHWFRKMIYLNSGVCTSMLVLTWQVIFFCNFFEGDPETAETRYKDPPKTWLVILETIIPDHPVHSSNPGRWSTPEIVFPSIRPCAFHSSCPCFPAHDMRP